MGYKVGDMVVYPRHGAARVEEILQRTVKGVTREYLKLSVLSSDDLEIFVPVDNLKKVGVRDIVDGDEVSRVFEILRTPIVEKEMNWSRRYKLNVEKIATGDVNNIAEVVRDLSQRDVDEHGLSAGEKRMLTKARSILTSEPARCEPRLCRAAGRRCRASHGGPRGAGTRHAGPSRVREQEVEEEVSDSSDLRNGLGFDAHRFADARNPRPFFLACLEWEGNGVEGDSDGDVAVHALIDALSSATGLGDIGTLFGVGADSRGAGMRGEAMLRETLRLVHAHGFEPVSMSISIIGNQPKIGCRRDEAQQRMSQICGCPVGITATTTDGMGFTGRGEGLAAIASVLVRKTVASA